MKEKKHQARKVIFWFDILREIVRFILQNMNTFARGFYNLVLVGDERSGKTTYSVKLKTRKFAEGYVPTIGVMVFPFEFIATSSRSPVKVRVMYGMRDTAGKRELSGLRSKYYCGGDCAIVMVDLTNLHCLQNAHNWVIYVMEELGDVPIVIVGNKIDEKTAIQKEYVISYFVNEIKPKVALHFKNKGYDGSNIHLHIISIKTGHNVYHPIIDLTRRLLKIKPPKQSQQL